MLVDAPQTASIQLGLLGKQAAVGIDSACSNAMIFGIIVSYSDVAQTLKLQGKAMFQFLCDAIAAHRNSTPAPSLA